MSSLDPKTEVEQIEENNPAVGWLDEIFDSKKDHENWRIQADETERVYRNRDSSVEKFNILWANTETLKPLLLANQTRAECEPQHSEPNAERNLAAKVLERSLNHHINLEGKQADKAKEQAVLDYLLAGRGVPRVFYDVELDEDGNKISEEVYVKGWPWRDFLHSTSFNWDQVWWAAFGYDMTRDDLVEEFGEKGRDIPLVGEMNGSKYTEWRNEYSNWRDDPSKWHDRNYARVWEIWNAREREVIIVAEGYDEIIERRDDPYNLEEFFPCPEPIYSIRTTNSLSPIPEYVQYQYQARELDILTRRINKLTDAMKVKGVGDNSIKSLKKLFDGEENEIFLDDDYRRLASAGGIEGAVTWLPIAHISDAVQKLTQRRNDALQIIYEITGISDIMRAANNPYESATATNKKDKWGHTRLWERQKAVNEMMRSTVRIMGEIISEQFSPEALLASSGIAIGELQVSGADTVIQILRSEFRDFLIDIETSATVSPEEEKRKEELVEFLPVFSDIVGVLTGAIQNQAMTPEVMSELLLFAVQRFDVGRDNYSKIQKGLQDSAQMVAQQQKQAQEMAQRNMAMQEAVAQSQVMMAKAEMKKAQVNEVRYQMDFQVEMEKLKLEWAKLTQKDMGEKADRQINLIEAAIKRSTAIDQAKISQEGRSEPN